jgi:hypothetical protein
MSNSLPEELHQRCALIAENDAQGVPLRISDYALLAVVTLLIPAILILIGALI